MVFAFLVVFGVESVNVFTVEDPLLEVNFLNKAKNSEWIDNHDSNNLLKLIFIFLNIFFQYGEYSRFTNLLHFYLILPCSKGNDPQQNNRKSSCQQYMNRLRLIKIIHLLMTFD